MANKISQDYAIYALDVLSANTGKRKPLNEKQRQLELGILKEGQAFSKYWYCTTRKFDVDHSDLYIEGTDDLVTAMFEWEYLDSDLQQIQKEFHMVINGLSKPGIGIVWTGEGANGFFYNIDWKQLENIANETVTPPTLFADETEEDLASRGL